MKHPYLIAVLVLLLSILPLHSQARADDVDMVASQFRGYCLQESTGRGQKLLDDAEIPPLRVDVASNWVRQQKPDGSWGDIDYQNNARSAWKPCDHLTRLLAIVVQARRTDTSPADRAADISAVRRGLTFWQSLDPKCPNWWYNQIGVPKLLGNIAILLSDDLSTESRQYISEVVLARSKVGDMTGQNKVWLAGNGIMRACLNHDPKLMAQAADVIQSEIRISSSEGIQEDYSFHQHGPQQQFGNYGMAFAVEMCRWAAVLRGTRFAFPSDKIQILQNYLLHGEQVVIWRDRMDVSSCGRQLFPNSMTKKAAALAGVMAGMATLTPDQAEAFTAMARRAKPQAINDLTGNFCFYDSDYILQRNPLWAVSLKMQSDRVIGGETVNSENLSGLLLADGATFFYRTGYEYDDIFPAWNWRQIPGVTAEQLPHPPQRPGKDPRAKRPAFVGGVSDGSTGAAAMHFVRDTLSARKAWFFTPEVTVCLGAGITDTSDVDVMTTINQSLADGPMQSAPGTAVNGNAIEGAFAGNIIHGGFRYQLLQPVNLSAKISQQKGNWATVFTNPDTPKGDVSRNIFCLGINHGRQPNNAGYAYAVSLAEVPAPSVRVLSNTAAVQAVAIGDRWLGAVFNTAGSLIWNGKTISVDQPAVLIITGDHLSLADPTHRLKSVHVHFESIDQSVDLPGDLYKGASVTCPVN